MWTREEMLIRVVVVPRPDVEVGGLQVKPHSVGRHARVLEPPAHLWRNRLLAALAWLQLGSNLLRRLEFSVLDAGRRQAADLWGSGRSVQRSAQDFVPGRQAARAGLSSWFLCSCFLAETPEAPSKFV